MNHEIHEGARKGAGKGGSFARRRKERGGHRTGGRRARCSGDFRFSCVSCVSWSEGFLGEVNHEIHEGARKGVGREGVSRGGAKNAEDGWGACPSVFVCFVCFVVGRVSWGGEPRNTRRGTKGAGKGGSFARRLKERGGHRTGRTVGEPVPVPFPFQCRAATQRRCFGWGDGSTQVSGFKGWHRCGARVRVWPAWTLEGFPSGG